MAKNLPSVDISLYILTVSYENLASDICGQQRIRSVRSEPSLIANSVIGYYSFIFTYFEKLKDQKSLSQKNRVEKNI